MNRGLLLASILSLAGLTVMAAVALTIEPPRVPLQNIAQKIGATVTVTATIASVDNRPDGWSRLRLQDANASIEAISNERIALSPGDLVDATGQVSTYGARIQLRIESASDVILRRAWQDHHVPLTRLLKEPWQHVGTHVLTSGTLTDRSLVSNDDAFTLAIRGATDTRGPALVQGLLEYDPKRGQILLSLHEATPLQSQT